MHYDSPTSFGVGNTAQADADWVGSPFIKNYHTRQLKTIKIYSLAAVENRSLI